MISSNFHRKPSRIRPKSRWALFALLLFLVSCAEPLQDKTEIRFWNGFTGPDGRTMIGLIKQFNEENPDIRVTIQRMDWITYYNKLFVAGLGDRSPEIFVIHTDALGRFIDAGFTRPVNDLIAAEPDFPIADFDKVPWEAARRDETQYAIPLDVHPIGMFYNKDLIVAQGFVDDEGNPDPPQTREAFVELLRSVRRDKEKGTTKADWGAVVPQYRNLVLSLMRQNGGRFFNDDYSRCLLASDKNAEALQFLVELTHDQELIASLEEYSYFDAWISFRQGRAAMTFEGVYMIGDLRKEKELDYGSAPLPLIFDKRATFAGSHNLCISSDAEEEEVEAAWRFIMFLSEHSLEWAEAGQVPARQSFRSSDEFREMEIQYGFSKQIPYIFYAPQVPFVFEFMTELDLAVEAAIRGRTTSKKALEQAAENVNEIIVRQQGGPQ